MTDTWDKRNISHLPGYDNPDVPPVDAPLTITVAYNSGTDKIVVQAVTGDFDDTDSLQFVTHPQGPFTLGSASFTKVSPTQIEVANFKSSFMANGSTKVQQVEAVQNPGTVLATWNGSVQVGPVQAIISNSSYETYYDAADPNGNFSCAGAATADATPGLFLYAEDFLAAGGDGVIVNTEGDGPFLIRYSTNPEYFLGAPQDSYLIILHDLLTGQHVTDITPVDAAGNAVGPAMTEDRTFAKVTAAGRRTDGTGVDVDFAAGNLVVPERLIVRQCPGTSRSYFRPDGPNAASNPVGITINQWNADAIDIDDPFISTTLLNVNQLQLRSATGNPYEVWGDPLPEMP